jgi:UPF0755 protein
VAVGAFALAIIAFSALVIAVIPSTILGSEPSTYLGPTSATGVANVTIKDGESAKDIAAALQDAGVIQSARLFRVLVAFMGIEDQLEAGDYEFDRGMVTLTVIDRIHNGITAPIMVTIPEGLRIEEIGGLLEKKGVVSASDFLTAAKKTDYSFPFLQGLSDGSLEGYLFPATYGFSRSVTAEQVVGEMLTAFKDKVVPEVQPQAPLIGLTLNQIITLASIVEREAVEPEERPLIASVYLNRLKVGMALQADPTVQYAIAADPQSVASYGYWKKGLSSSDLQIVSSYNTYLVTGLPPGPIAAPGLDSIKAVLQPAHTNYLFFVAKGDGSHAFAETLDEQLQNIQKYQH